jgi:hypothetical protein
MLLIDIFAQSKNERYVKPFSNYYHCGGPRQKAAEVRMECVYTKQEKAFLTTMRKAFSV